MAISQKLHTKLVQKLILTPSLQQAIKLLPLTTLELAEVLEQEVMENPLLEEVPVEETRTTEEWPRANQTPVAADSRPRAISERVALSIAAMWSASNAWRRPSV